ncbi:MAG TPA: polyamine aminopropyltransferase [Gammaproteobacteria bacterium]
MPDERWFAETLTPHMRLALEASRVLVHERTGEHEIALIENDVFGRVLLLDGAVQVTSRDEFIYHEMMAHVPILAHGSARDVLIIGGGDCGLAEEVLKHASVRRLVQVEIDPKVVELAREHFAEMNAPVFTDARFELTIGDGAVYARDAADRFDVVLVDSTDPVGPGAVLFTREFYGNVRERLKPGGVLVTQNGVPFLQAGELASAMSGLAATFRHVAACAICVPTYCGGHLVLGFCSDDDAPLRVEADELERRYAAAGLTTRYYSPRHHAAAFVLPRYIAEALEEAVAAGRAAAGKS